MKRNGYVIALLMMAVAGCGDGKAPTTDATAPAAAPAPTPGSVTVSWSVPSQNTDGTALTDITGYRVLYGTSAGNLDASSSVTGASTTSLVLSGLTSGTSYYIAVATVNAAGTASDPSSVVAITVP